MKRPDYPTGDPRTAPLVALRQLMPVPPEPNAEARLLHELERKERADERR